MCDNPVAACPKYINSVAMAVSGPRRSPCLCSQMIHMQMEDRRMEGLSFWREVSLMVMEHNKIEWDCWLSVVGRMQGRALSAIGWFLLFLALSVREDECSMKKANIALVWESSSRYTHRKQTRTHNKRQASNATCKITNVSSNSAVAARLQI